MDSVTQILLGASVAELVIGRAIGRRAALYGAMLGTLPDLDVLIPFGGPVEDFTYHRGFSHSLLVLSAATPVIGWALYKFQGLTSLKHWIGMVWLVLITHVLLDAMTVYGTQLFWPITEYPVSGSVVFIIDPSYTIWLLLGVLAVLVFKRDKPLGYRLNAIGFCIASTYLVWAWTAKSIVTDVAAKTLSDKGISYTKLLSTPAPFNTLLWRFIAVEENGNYHEGYYSLLDGSDKATFDYYKSEEDFLRPLQTTWPVKRLKWFTHGFYKVSVTNADDKTDVVISDLRMGVEGQYVFQFKVGTSEVGGPLKSVNERLREPRDVSRLPLVFKRILDPTISLAP